MTTPDYQSLIDAPTWDFIRKTESFSSDLPGVEGYRDGYDRMCGHFHAPYPPGVSARDEDLGPIPLRIYEPQTPRGTAVYFHGGGFVVGGLHSHDSICADLSADQTRIIAVDYRLAPEHPHPAAYDDALRSTQAMLARFGPLVVMGDSAGGTLAAAVAHAMRPNPDIRGVLLVYPGLGGDIDAGSYLAHANAPLLTRAGILADQGLRFDGPVPQLDPRAFPLRDTRFTGLPPITIFAAECDPICDDGPAYAQAIRAAGGQASCKLHQGLPHGWLRARHCVPRAGAAFDDIKRALHAMTA